MQGCYVNIVCGFVVAEMDCLASAGVVVRSHLAGVTKTSGSFGWRERHPEADKVAVLQEPDMTIQWVVPDGRIGQFVLIPGNGEK